PLDRLPDHRRRETVAQSRCRVCGHFPESRGAPGMLGARLELSAADTQEFAAGRPGKGGRHPRGTAFRSAGARALAGAYLLPHRSDHSCGPNSRWPKVEDADDSPGRIRAVQQAELGPDREVAFVMVTGIVVG